MMGFALVFKLRAIHVSPDGLNRRVPVMLWHGPATITDPQTGHLEKVVFCSITTLTRGNTGAQHIGC